MEARKCTPAQGLLREIMERLSGGKTQREVAQALGLRDKYVVKRLLVREREKQRKQLAGIMPRPQGRPRKDTPPRDMATEQAYEIKRLRMENTLLRDFLQFVGRK